VIALRSVVNLNALGITPGTATADTKTLGCPQTCVWYRFVEDSVAETYELYTSSSVREPLELSLCKATERSSSGMASPEQVDARKCDRPGEGEANQNTMASRRFGCGAGW